MELSQARDRSTPTCITRLGVDIWVCPHVAVFSFCPAELLIGMPTVCGRLPSILVWHRKKAQVPLSPPSFLLDALKSVCGLGAACLFLHSAPLCTLTPSIADCTVCYQAVISSSSTCCLISAVTLNVIPAFRLHAL